MIYRVFSVIVLLVVLRISIADEHKQDNINQQLSKRPYAEAIKDSDTDVDKKEVEQQRQLNLNMLSKRPYMKKATD
jgi:hypothetical protein